VDIIILVLLYFVSGRGLVDGIKNFKSNKFFWSAIYFSIMFSGLVSAHVFLINITK
jgi:hypothetical protein